MNRTVWACEDCGLECPPEAGSPGKAACGACGGRIERVSDVFVYVIDVLEAMCQVTDPRPS
jgi:hypothetical protein